MFRKLFEITSSSDLSEKIVSYLQQDEFAYDIDIVRAERGRIIGSLKTHKCTACRTLQKQTASLSQPTVNPTANLSGRFWGSDTMVRSLMRELERENVTGEVVRLSKLKDEEDLTRGKGIFFKSHLRKVILISRRR